MSLSVRVQERANDGYLLTIGGELDAATAPLLRAELADLPVVPGQSVVVDFQAVVFIDSSGLGVLATAASRLASGGATLLIAHPSEQARAVIRMTHLDDIVAILDDADAAGL